jgi:hypothetical protein
VTQAPDDEVIVNNNAQWQGGILGLVGRFYFCTRQSRIARGMAMREDQGRYARIEGIPAETPYDGMYISDII